MTACGSLHHILEASLPEKSALSPWNQIIPIKPLEQSAFTDIFGESRFKDASFSIPSSPSSPASSLSSSPSSIIDKDDKNPEKDKNPSQNSFSMNSESLQLCTEGLGFESFDDVEDSMKLNMNDEWRVKDTKVSFVKNENSYGEVFKRARRSGGAFPPPISCIGSGGKPWVSFQPHRENGRFVLTEIRVPTQEILHAHREDGCLKLKFIHSDDELEEDDDEESYDDEFEEDDDEEDDEESYDDDFDEDEDEEIEKNEEDGNEENGGLRNDKVDMIHNPI